MQPIQARLLTANQCSSEYEHTLPRGGLYSILTKKRFLKPDTIFLTCCALRGQQRCKTQCISPDVLLDPCFFTILFIARHCSRTNINVALSGRSSKLQPTLAVSFTTCAAPSYASPPPQPPAPLLCTKPFAPFVCTGLNLGCSAYPLLHCKR